MPDNLTPLSDSEKNSIRVHLGYPSINPVPMIALGVPAKTQTAFLVDFALENVTQSAVGRVRTLLATLDDLEDQIRRAPIRQQATVVGEIQTNPEELQRLEEHYLRWAYELANCLGCPVYEGAAKFQGGTGRMPLLLPVRRRF